MQTGVAASKVLILVGAGSLSMYLYLFVGRVRF